MTTTDVMSLPTDADLAVQFAAGNPDSVRAVYIKYGRLVFSTAYQVLRDADLAEDATQQTFVQAWRACHRFDPARELAAWLTTIARRVAIDLYRRERRHRARFMVETAADRSADAPESSVEQLDAVLTVRQALVRLPDQDRELVRMQHFEELTHSEIAAQLQVPLGTVKSRSFRAHRRLAGLLRDEDGPAGS